MKNVFYKGRKCGEQVRFSQGLTIAVLNMAARQRIAATASDEFARFSTIFLIALSELWEVRAFSRRAARS